jgi:uncharacterized protein YbaR (Trm112 family)
MKRETLDILRCPVCLGEFSLEVIEGGEEITRGILTCKNCGRRYRIEEGIPMLLPELAEGGKND